MVHRIEFHVERSLRKDTKCSISYFFWWYSIIIITVLDGWGFTKEKSNLTDSYNFLAYHVSLQIKITTLDWFIVQWPFSQSVNLSLCCFSHVYHHFNFELTSFVLNTHSLCCSIHCFVIWRQFRLTTHPPFVVVVIRWCRVWFNMLCLRKTTKFQGLNEAENEMQWSTYSNWI